MKRVPLAEFKAHCSRYVEEVGDEEIVITKHGKAVARLSPAEPSGSLWDLRGILEGELLADPEDEMLSTGARWDAES